MAMQLVSTTSGDANPAQGFSASRASRGQQQLALLQARRLDDAQRAISLLRDQTTVVLQLGGLDAVLRQRLEDLVHGAACAMDAQMIRFSPDVVVLQPPGAAQVGCN